MPGIEFSPECDCDPRCASQREHYWNNWWCPPCRWDYEIAEARYTLGVPIEQYGSPRKIVGHHNARHTKEGHPKPPDRPTRLVSELQQTQAADQLASEARLRARGLLPTSERRRWTRDELLIALGLYLRLPFGQLHQHHPEIIASAELLGRTPSALAMKLTNLASLDDSLDRAGLANASNADRAIWAEMQADWSAITDEIHEVQVRLGVETDDEEADDYAGEDALRLTKVRRDQSQFRTRVLSAYNYRCCVTGLTEPRLLEAAHIAPWRDDPKNQLNPSNGLCLSVLHHRAFDRGLITLDDGFRLLISPQLATRGDHFIGTAFTPFVGKPIAMPTKFAPDPELLARHRERIFLAAG